MTAASAAAPLAQWDSLSQSVNKVVRVIYGQRPSESSGARNVNGFWVEEPSCPAAAPPRPQEPGEQGKTNKHTNKQKTPKKNVHK